MSKQLMHIDDTKFILRLSLFTSTAGLLVFSSSTKLADVKVHYLKA